MPLPPWPILLLVILLALVAAERILFWMGRKGWIHYRRRKPDSSSRPSFRGVLSTFQEIVQPEIRYVKEDRDQRAATSGSEDPSNR
jgi:hypothetical protein